jgi:hypothetical protein
LPTFVLQPVYALQEARYPSAYYDAFHLFICLYITFLLVAYTAVTTTISTRRWEDLALIINDTIWRFSEFWSFGMFVGLDWICLFVFLHVVGVLFCIGFRTQNRTRKLKWLSVYQVMLMWVALRTMLGVDDSVRYLNDWNDSIIVAILIAAETLL